jgi:hypothetical protein
MGRPSDYSDELADAICVRLAQGDSLRKICKDEDMPGESTVYAWLFKDEAFQEKYARARTAQSEPWLEDIIEVADDPEMKADDKRVRIDARKWAMSKLAAKKYGERKLIGSDPDNPLPTPALLDPARLSSGTLREVIEAFRDSSA